MRNSPLWEQDPRQQLAYLCVKRWARLHAPDVLLGLYTPDELEESRPRVERDVTPPPATAAGMNALINGKTADTAPVEEKQATQKEERSPEELLSAFSEKAMHSKTVEELEKAYKFAAKLLAGRDDLLETATDVYGIRKNELLDIPM